MKKIGRVCLAIFKTIFGIIRIVIASLIPLWNGMASGRVWFSIFYQPFIVGIAFVVLSPQAHHLLDSSDRFMWIIIMAFETIAITFTINILIEFFHCLGGKEDSFSTTQELQRHANNYALIIISLIALYISAFPTNSEENNLILLLVGGLFFVSTISSDAYRVFVHSKGSVKRLAKKVKEIVKGTEKDFNMDKQYSMTYEGEQAQFAFHVNEEEKIIGLCLLIEDSERTEKDIDTIRLALEGVNGLKFLSNENVEPIMYVECKDEEDNTKHHQIEVRYYIEGTDIKQFIEMAIKVFEVLEEMGIEEMRTI